jgi:hypothetical protein
MITIITTKYAKEMKINLVATAIGDLIWISM